MQPQKNEFSLPHVLEAKHMNNINYGTNFIWKQGASNLWKGICKADIVLKQGVRKVVCSRKITRFWCDRWLHNEPLITKATREITDDEAKKYAADYWTMEHT